ncbi:MAG: hypothetical protein Q9218_005963 [Villophora microphyllina]
MHLSNSIGFLGLSPLVHCSLNTCRIAPPIFYQQCPAPWADHRLSPHWHTNTQSYRLSHTSAQQSNIAYRVGAAFSAKGRRFNTKQDLYTFNFDRRSSEKRPFTGRPASGQDAFFVSNVGSSGSTAFGVADGVGGWSDSGIDSADFSHALCRYLTKNARDNAEEQKLGAQTLLQQGYVDVVADKTIPGGGSTACIAVGHADGHLEVANLGDSGFIQFRLNAVHNSSNPQTHAFNTPYQLSIIPPRILARSRIFGGTPLHDFPQDASVTHHQVRHGDVLVFATDGVWDNLNPSELLQIVSRHMTGFQGWKAGQQGTEVGEELGALTQEGGIPKEKENTLQTSIAVAITGEAKAASLDTKRDGPFAKEIHKFYPHEDYRGGKVDDITTVVALVVDPRKGNK